MVFQSCGIMIKLPCSSLFSPDYGLEALSFTVWRRILTCLFFKSIAPCYVLSIEKYSIKDEVRDKTGVVKGNKLAWFANISTLKLTDEVKLYGESRGWCLDVSMSAYNSSVSSSFPDSSAKDGSLHAKWWEMDRWMSSLLGLSKRVHVRRGYRL